jgi:predicted nucleotidyltransferase
MDDSLSRPIAAAAALLRSYGARDVFVFGSVVHGALRPDSDIDMAVSGLPPQVFFRAMSEASDVIGRPVDLLDLDVGSPIVTYVLRSGELISVD